MNRANNAAEHRRLEEYRQRTSNWKKWGPYLSERAWGTVREDYSEDGNSWDFLPHDHARSRAYRWNEDGLAGISDDHQRMCFALALWNGKDAILKERLFGLDERSGELTERGHRIIAHTPMGRFGQPDDLIGPALLLLSEAAGFMHGTTLTVDGGISVYGGV